MVESINSFFIHFSSSVLLFIGILVLEIIIIRGRILVLLVLADQIIHIALCLGELHLVHSLSGIPVQECFSSEHGRELFGDALEHILDCGRVADECGGHFQSFWWYVTNGGLDVVWNPLDKIRRVLVHHIQHLLVHFFGAHPSSEHCRCGQVSSMTRIRCAHHVLCIKHLLRQFWHRECAILLRSSRRQRRKSSHEKVQSREWHQVDRQF